MSFEEPPFKDIFLDNVNKLTRTWWIWFVKLYDTLKDLNLRTGGITVRVTTTPYTVVSSVKNIMCDTDATSISVNYIAGLQGQELNVYNTGDSGNEVTLNAFTGEPIKGEITQTLFDNEVYNGVFDVTEFWR